MGCCLEIWLSNDCSFPTCRTPNYPVGRLLMLQDTLKESKTWRSRKHEDSLACILIWATLRRWLEWTPIRCWWSKSSDCRKTIIHHHICECNHYLKPPLSINKRILKSSHLIWKHTHDNDVVQQRRSLIYKAAWNDYNFLRSCSW